MLHSFKLKIAFFSVLISGTILLASSLFFIQMTYHIGIDRTDRELRALVEADMRKIQPPNHWMRFDESLRTFFGDAASKQFILKVYDNKNMPLYESSHWQEEIGAAQIPLPPPMETAQNVKIEPKRKRPFNKPHKKRPPPPTPLKVGTPEFATIGTWRIMAIRNPAVCVVLGISLNPLNAEIARFRNALLLAVPFALLLMTGGGWLLAQLALRPIRTIARTAERVSATHLDQRIPSTRTDHEFRHLIEVINQMLDRLEASFQQAARFSADAAHELKTPLAILQGELENALQAAPDGSGEQQTYKELLDEVQRLKTIIRKLLLLAQADGGRLPLHVETLNFTEMVENVCEDIKILNPNIDIQAELQPGIQVEGDADLLTQAIQNLADNAVKFCQGESPIVLSLKSDGQQVKFLISNRGETIPETDRDKVFERFYRADKARTHEIGGAGLGLSLAREIALAHGGTLELIECGELQTTFRLTIPV